MPASPPETSPTSDALVNRLLAQMRADELPETTTSLRE